MSFLFPEQNPPMLPQSSTVPEACIWLLAVMDDEDNGKKFVASLLIYHIDRGFLTERQMDALRALTSRIIGRFVDGDLECQGAKPAEVQTLDFGNVVPMRRAICDGEVLE